MLKGKGRYQVESHGIKRWRDGSGRGDALTFLLSCCQQSKQDLDLKGICR
jgi:hypothetical protein